MGAVVQVMFEDMASTCPLVRYIEQLMEVDFQGNLGGRNSLYRLYSRLNLVDARLLDSPERTAFRAGPCPWMSSTEPPSR